MGEASSAPGQVISLPKGGGALQGLGEKFSPDLFTGTGNFTVPITLPAGRNSFQPHLNLVYSSGTGNGPFGLGWSVSIPGISRKTSKGVPIYDDTRDVFIISGAEDLVPVSDAPPGTTRYRPRTEGLFARILHHRTLSNNYWEVRSKDGLISLYGTQGVAGSDPAVVSDPGLPQQARVFAWRLSQTTDPFGNRIAYSYLHDAAHTDGPHIWDQAYLSEVRYVDYGDPGNPQFLFGVQFVYEDRPDRFSAYRAGFEIRTIKRCSRIEIHTNPGAHVLARTYHLTYLDQRGLPPDQLPPNGVSLLSQIQVEGHDGDALETLPPLECGYTQFEPQQRTFIPLTGPEMPAVSLAGPDRELVDLMGNGLPDILETNGVMRYWRNLGGGRFDLPREMAAAPAGLRLSDKGVQLLDANGDSRPDLLVTTDAISGYYPMRFGGLWDHKSFHRYRQAPSFDLKDPEVRLVDLDGDGVTDAIRSGTRLECFFNDPHDGWNSTRWVERQAAEVFPNTNFSDPRVKWADITGDGLQDVVLVHDGLIEYWPNLGRGNWAKRVLMHHSPRFPSGYDPKRILLGDVDGDGLADLAYVDDTKVTLWINQCGNGWSEPIKIEGTPPVSDLDGVRLTDMLGQGVSGILWSSDATSPGHAHLFFLDFTGGTKPYLVNEMGNHMGTVTRVGYAPSTRFYLQDSKRADTRWKTPLPFPVQVVARVEVIDGLSGGKLTTEYSYHHGYWEGAEREFRGFGRVDQRDTETFDDYHLPGLHLQSTPFAGVAPRLFSPPTETRTWFHQGAVGDELGDWGENDYSVEFWPGDPPAFPRRPAQTALLDALPRRVKRDALRSLRSYVLRTELYALDGSADEARPLTVTEYLVGVQEETLPGPSDGGLLHLFFPHILAERTTQWERGAEPLTQLIFTDDYDGYGRPHSQIRMAVPRGRDFRAPAAPGAPYLATQTETTYVQRDDDHRFIVDRTSRATSYEIVNDGSPPAPTLHAAILAGTTMRQIVGQTVNFYDGPAFAGLPFGMLGDYGALVRTETLVLTEELLQDAYTDDKAFLTPPYLEPSGLPQWTAEYPPEFQTLLPVKQPAEPSRPDLVISPAAYGFASGGGTPFVRGYFVATERRQYDVQEEGDGQGRGLITVKRTPVGRDTQIIYDAYEFLPVEVRDPVGLVTSADYDYRVLQPRVFTTPNGSRTAYTFTPLGLMATMAVMGKAADSVGDTATVPGTRFVYDFTAYETRGAPISVRSIRRVHHVNDADVPLPDRDDTIERIEYSDGFGRLLQTRIQAEDVRFGDAPFDSVGLPEDQTVAAGDAAGRARADTDPPYVVVSGWQVYDNKGRVVEKYEPFFSTGWDYDPDAQNGEKITLHYDSLGRVVRTVNPDGSEHRTIHGIPLALADPDKAVPTPWETYTYDANDNAGRTHAADSIGYQSHWNTPASIEIDALGRTVRALQRNGTDPSAAYTTTSTYDVRGNLLTITDTLGRRISSHRYDLENRPLRFEHLDAGVRRSLLDAAGNVIEGRDGRGALVLRAYDALNRPIRLWARDNGSDAITLRERVEYGDGSDPNQPANARLAAQAANLLGNPQRHYDEAGLVTVDAYDFKGNILAKTRQVISDTQILSVFAQADSQNWGIQAFRVDWQPPNGGTLQELAMALLDATMYQTSLRYDALSRVTSVVYPRAVDGSRRELRPRYNRAGLLEAVELDGAAYVEHIAYDAKGQRTLIAYANGIMTRYGYDPRTFRLVRLCTQPYTTLAALTYRPTSLPLQDLGYAYDLVGNARSIQDRTHGSGVLNNPDALQAGDPQLAQLLAGGDALLRRFVYDPLYHVISATGRECRDIPQPRPWTDDPRCGFNSSAHGTPTQDNAPALTAMYREDYGYDPADNVVSLKHSSNGNAWTRSFGAGGQTPAQWSQAWPAHLGVPGAWLNPPGNQLTHVGDNNPATPQTHGFDENGNLIQETGVRHFEWDHADRMRVYRTQAADAEPTVHAHHLYGADGHRVKTLVRKPGGRVDVTINIDGAFEHHRRVRANATAENTSVHVMDTYKRIVLVRVGTPFPDDPAPAVQYHLADHLGSGAVVADETGTWLNREEYTAYGETSFGSFARKRYRYTGRERDEYSGLSYHGLRYYAPWLARWTACDPAVMKDGLNLYVYVSGNPLHFVDPGGTDGKPPEPPAAAPEGQPKDAPRVHMIIVGTNPPEGDPHHLRPPRAIISRVDTLINKETTAAFEKRYRSGDRITVLYPESLDSRLVKELKTYGKKYGAVYETVQVPAGALKKTLQGYSNVISLYFFGHGGSRPLFVYNGDVKGAYEFFPKPTRKNLGENFFLQSPDTLATFITCHSWDYAKQVSEEFHIEAQGVKGTTWYGEETVSAGRLTPESARGTSELWLYFWKPYAPDEPTAFGIPGGVNFLQRVPKDEPEKQ